MNNKRSDWLNGTNAPVHNMFWNRRCCSDVMTALWFETVPTLFHFGIYRRDIENAIDDERTLNAIQS